MPNPQQLPSTIQVSLLKNYEISKYIARGSYGMVFSGTYSPPPTAEDANPAKIPVAIKVIKDYLCGLTPIGFKDASLQDDAPGATDTRKFSDRYRGVYIKRIVREIQILRYFKGCFEFIELLDAYFSPNGRDLYLVMPFVPYSARSLLSATAKTQLRLYMKNTGKTPNISSTPAIGLPEDVVRVIMVQLLSGLQKMERSNCGHRDLTAANILIESDSLYTYLCDFGLSRAHMAAEDNMTLEVVTQPYRAPELLFQCAKYDQAIDIWSAGIVMFELLTGTVPVLEKDVPRQLLSVLQMASAGGTPDLKYWQSKGAKESALRYISMKMSPTSEESASMSKPKSSVRTMLESRRSGKHLRGIEEGTNFASYFSQAPLSESGMEVLESLLHEMPEKRKNYDELLSMKWFQDNIDCREQLAVMAGKQPSGAMSVSFNASATEAQQQATSTTTSDIPNIERMTLEEQITYLSTKLVLARADRTVNVQMEGN